MDHSEIGDVGLVAVESTGVEGECGREREEVDSSRRLKAEVVDSLRNDYSGMPS